MAKHDKYLKPFTGLFKAADTDTNGILNEEEFKKLVSEMKVCSSEDEMNELASQIDPLCHQQITFSQCAKLFSIVLVQMLRVFRRKPEEV